MHISPWRQQLHVSCRVIFVRTPLGLEPPADLAWSSPRRQIMPTCAAMQAANLFPTHPILDVLPHTQVRCILYIWAWSGRADWHGKPYSVARRAHSRKHLTFSHSSLLRIDSLWHALDQIDHLMSCRLRHDQSNHSDARTVAAVHTCSTLNF